MRGAFSSNFLLAPPDKIGVPSCKSKGESHSRNLAPLEGAERAILILRGRRVILDSDLAALYGVTVSRFNEQVKRNAGRFPEDFAFQLTREEHEALRSQNAISKNAARGGRRYLPYVFTEHGAVMAASVLSTPRAIAMSVEVVRAFVRLRALMTSHQQLAGKLAELERRVASQDRNIVALFEAVRGLMRVPERRRRPIGFHTKDRG